MLCESVGCVEQELRAVSFSVDIDECQDGGCSQIQGATCHNTAGSFECQCRPGYRLSGDLSTCEGMICSRHFASFFFSITIIHLNIQDPYNHRSETLNINLY